MFNYILLFRENRSTLINLSKEAQITYVVLALIFGTITFFAVRKRVKKDRQNIQAEFTKIGDELEYLIAIATKFKIGKTRRSAKQEFLDEYSDIYSNFKELARSPREDFINGLETYLILRFKDLPNCDNSRAESKQLSRGKKYTVYIFYR